LLFHPPPLFLSVTRLTGEGLVKEKQEKITNYELQIWNRKIDDNQLVITNLESISLSEIEGLMLDERYVSFPCIVHGEPVECG